MIIAASLFIRIRILNVPLERDEGEYAYIAQLLLKGHPPYAQAYTMKLPGVPLFYAICMLIFGQTVAAIHGGLLLANAASAILIYLIGRKLCSRDAAAAAAAFFAILSLGRPVMGIFAHATHLVVFFSLLGIWLMTVAAERRRSALLFAAGLALGLAVLMKQHAALLILFLLIFRPAPPSGETRRERRCGILLLVAGSVLPYLAVVTWVLASGQFTRFWFWTVSYASQYASGLSLQNGLHELSDQFVPILRENILIWVAAATGVALVARQRREPVAARFLPGYLLISFLMVSPGFYYRPHYFILLLPPVALLAGTAAAAAGSLLPGRAGRVLPALILLLAICSYSFQERDYLFRNSPDQVSRSVYGANPFPEAAAIAAYIRSRSTPADRVAVLGSEPEILFHTNRLSATGHIYMYGMMEGHRYAEEMQRQLMEEIEQTQPLFIVVVNNPASWLLNPNSRNDILDWGDAYIPLRYDEVGMVEFYSDEPARFWLDGAVAGHEPESDVYISLFRRRW